MGCGPSTQILINFDQPNASFLPGDIVKGTVQLIIISDTLNVDRVDTSLIGEIAYTTKQVHHVDGKRKTRVVYHRKKILLLTVSLAIPESGKREIEYAKGQYSWPFQFQLPDYLPPTIGQPHTYPHISYYARVLIDRPWYTSNDARNQYIFVRQRINPTQHMDTPTNAVSNHNRKNVVIKGSLNKLVFKAGEAITVTLDVNNPGEEMIKEIIMNVVKNQRLAGDYRTQVLYNQIVPEMVRRNERQFVQTFRVIVPSGPLLSSFNYQGGVEEIIETYVNYSLKLDINIEGFFDDFSLIIPFVLVN